MRSSGRPSGLQALLARKLREYNELKRLHEKLRSELLFTPRFAPNPSLLHYRYENNRPIASNTPALEKDIEKHNLHPLFSPRNYSSYFVNFRPEGASPFLRQLLAKVLPHRVMERHEYTSKRNLVEKTRSELSLKPRPSFRNIKRSR